MWTKLHSSRTASALTGVRSEPSYSAERCGYTRLVCGSCTSGDLVTVARGSMPNIPLAPYTTCVPTAANLSSTPRNVWVYYKLHLHKCKLAICLAWTYVSVSQVGLVSWTSNSQLCADDLPSKDWLQPGCGLTTESVYLSAGLYCTCTEIWLLQLHTVIMSNSSVLIYIQCVFTKTCTCISFV